MGNHRSSPSSVEKADFHFISQASKSSALDLTVINKKLFETIHCFEIMLSDHLQIDFQLFESDWDIFYLNYFFKVVVIDGKYSELLIVCDVNLREFILEKD